MFSRWRNAILGTLLMLAGLATALLTSWARQRGAWELARVGAFASLAFVALIAIFMVPPLVRAARLEVGRFNLPLQLTPGGALFAGIFAVVAFAAYNTGNNLLFLIFSLMTATLFVAWTAARASLGDLVVSARFPDHIFAAEPAPVIVRLHNKKRLWPSFSVLVEARVRLSETPAAKSRWRRRPRARFETRPLAYFVYVPHRAWNQQRIEQTFPRRGHVLVTGFELSTRFPFGFFRLRRRLHARDVDLVIYPRLELASDELHLLPMQAGRLVSPRRGAGRELHALRDYLPHDDVRHIDWKATARARRLTVREFAAEDERRVHVVFDTRVAATIAAGDSEEAWRGRLRFERGVTLAASLVAHFVEERAEIKLTVGADHGSYDIGTEHLYACLRRLALVEPEVMTADTSGSGRDWANLFDESPRTSASAGGSYVILLTTAAPGTIPAHVWRKSHVIYL
ncbi:MAG: DUF58 domain-containing protein [Pyrinomonadaceae bacterium]